MAPIATLTVRLSAQIAEFQSEFKDATKSAQKFADDFQGVATKAAAVGAFFGTIAADIAKSLASGLASALRDAVKFSSEFNNAFIGLSSVARHFGEDTDLATAAAKRLSADGLLPLRDSAAGLKNLLAAGFNLDQATKLMNAFKDSAAFGRQGALSFGDAIRGATEGVKNGNSIMVDNSGITKNLSQILKEAGFSAQDLSRATSDAGVRMALFNGILKEASAFTGDAAKLTQTYTGAVTRLETSYHTMLASIGDAITQNKDVALAIGFVGDSVQRLTGFLAENHRGFTLVSEAVILVAKTFGGLITALDIVHGALNDFDTNLRTVIKGLADSTVSLADLLLKIVEIGLKLPGSTIAFQAFAAEIVTLAAVSAKAKDVSADMARGIRENDASTTSWTMGLGVAKGAIDGLVRNLETARGQTVKLGDAQGGVSAALGKLNTAQKTAITLTSEMTQVSALMEKAHRHEVAALQFEESAWKSWEATVSKALSNIATNPVLLQGRDLSGLVPQVGAATTHIPPPILPPSFFQQMFDPKAIGLALGQSITAAIQGGGNVFAAAASTLGQAFTGNLAKYLTGSIAEGGKAIGGFLGGAINAVLPGLGALLGPLVGKITGALANAFGLGTAGRDIVSAFAKQFQEFDLNTMQFKPGGGFDELHAKLLEIGAEGERLWIALTQGVGRNNPEQARAVIDLITKALAAQKSALIDTTGAVIAQGDAQTEAARKAQAAIEEMTGKIQSLEQSIANEAPEEVIGIIEANTRAQIQAIKDERTAAQAAMDQTTKDAADAAKEAGDIIDTALAAREFHIKVKVDLDGLPGGAVPALASGGIVRRRTLALVGEHGPEAVVPLSRMGRFGGTPNLDVTLRLPNNQILLRQFVQGLKAEGLA